MENSIFLYKTLPIIVKVTSILIALLAGYLVYSGLSNRLEKQHYQFRIRQAVNGRKEEFKKKASTSKTEMLLKEAGYPLGINGLRYELIKWGTLIFLLLNYLFYPYLTTGDFNPLIILGILFGTIFFNPNFAYSLTRFILKRLISYKQTKRNSELFSLYDMLISELQMMQTTRVNAYSLIRTLKPYFKEIEGPLNLLLVNWTSDAGPEYALDVFAEDIGSNEAKSLANVLKKFDENRRETLLQSLKGMEDMFITSQIENYRRKRKLYVDLANLPIKAAHWLVILNFIVVVVYMVSFLLQDARL